MDTTPIRCSSNSSSTSFSSSFDSPLSFSDRSIPPSPPSPSLSPPCSSSDDINNNNNNDDNYSYSGHIELVLGPMFSGKTSELLRRVRRYKIANKQTLLIKYAKDIRYDIEHAVTHDQIKEKAISALQLSEISIELIRNADVIGIDEGQFYSDIVSFSDEWANKGKIIVIAALDGTFERKGFQHNNNNNINNNNNNNNNKINNNGLSSLLDLIPMSESITKLSAVCMRCQGEAAFTKRLIHDNRIELIGGDDMYIATCRKCFFKM